MRSVLVDLMSRISGVWLMELDYAMGRAVVSSMTFDLESQGWQGHASSQSFAAFLALRISI